MKVNQLNHKGIKFLVRAGTSDEKTFNEVIVGNAYERNEFKIKAGEHWIDLGGNVGAFTLKAIQRGATVDVYEPDPFSCRMIEKNLKLNGFNANIIQKAVVVNRKKRMSLYVGNGNQVWRNSLYKNWGNEKFTVDCIHFEEVIKADSVIKMDIEGAEMPILEAMQIFPAKMVFEWSFDLDRSLTRYRIVRKIMIEKYNYLHGSEFDLDYVVWAKNWSPACVNVYCDEKI